MPVNLVRSFCKSVLPGDAAPVATRATGTIQRQTGRASCYHRAGLTNQKDPTALLHSFDPTHRLRKGNGITRPSLMAACSAC